MSDLVPWWVSQPPMFVRYAFYILVSMGLGFMLTLLMWACLDFYLVNGLYASVFYLATLILFLWREGEISGGLIVPWLITFLPIPKMVVQIAFVAMVAYLYFGKPNKRLKHNIGAALYFLACFPSLQPHPKEASLHPTLLREFLITHYVITSVLCGVALFRLDDSERNQTQRS